jgi:hypothetical protein
VSQQLLLLSHCGYHPTAAAGQAAYHFTGKATYAD